MKNTRRIIQFGFLALTLVGVFVVGGNAERWCPFGGVEALYSYVTEGDVLCSLGVSNFYILGAVLVITVLLRRAFCGYMCPIGTVSQWLRTAGRRLGIKTGSVPYKLDRVLGLLKYVLLVVILVATWRAGELLWRGYDPCYALISRHGTDITFWAYVVSGAIVVVSLFVMMPFCRWFCPLAAVLSPFSRFALTRIKRDRQECSDCKLCGAACPMAVPVDQLGQVTSARCISCMRCVDVCPQRRSGAIGWGPPDLLGRRWPQAVLVVVLLLCTTGAVAAAYFFPLPSYVRSRGNVPAEIAVARLKIHDVRCRGRANMLLYFLERDDLYQIPGYFKLEAWPGPGAVDVQIGYDPAKTDAQSINRAITEPYYDVLADLWRNSPFTIEGYDPLNINLDWNTPTAPPPR